MAARTASPERPSRPTHSGGVIFLVDRGFNVDENEKLFTQNGNDHVFPLDSNDNRCKGATSSSLGDLKDQFVWQRGGKTTLVQNSQYEIDGRRVIVYRDLPRREEERNHRRHIDAGDSGYTAEKLAEKAPYLGVYVLQTSLPKGSRSAKKVFTLYKDRWQVETYFDYFKNGQDGYTLCQQSHCRQQGLAFVILVAGLIECKVRGEIQDSGVGMSVSDVLRDARALKADRHGGDWVINNRLKKRNTWMRKLDVAMEATPSRAA